MSAADIQLNALSELANIHGSKYDSTAAVIFFQTRHVRHRRGNR